MNTGWQGRQIAPDVHVVATRAMPALDPETARHVDALWEEARATRPALFDGRIFTADRVTPHLIEGHWTRYRRVLAQMREPALFETLRLQPLAVVGVIVTPDGIVIGRRSADALYQAGAWQSCPAGSVEAREGEETIDLAAQLKAEALEELGLPPETLHVERALAVVEHPGTRILDIGLLARTSLRFADMRALWQASGNAEYEALDCVWPTNDAQAAGVGKRLEPTWIFLNALLADGS
jgi:hypothetical protein